MARNLYGYDFSLFGSVDSGSAAPHFDPEPEGEVVPFRSPSKRSSKKKKKTVVTKADRATTFASFLRTVIVLSVVAVVFISISAAMYCNAQLDATAKKISSVEAEIEIAKSENIRLNSYLQGLASADKIEQYAVNILGMVKLEDYKVTYLEQDDKNQVVISGGKSYDDDGAGSKLEKLKEYLFH